MRKQAEATVSPPQTPGSQTSGGSSRPVSEDQENASDLTTVLGVISRARLSARERQVVAEVSGLLVQNPPDSTPLPPPTYTE